MTRTIARILWLATTRWRGRQSRADRYEAALHALDQRFSALEAEVQWLRREVWVRGPSPVFGRPRLVPRDDQN